MSDFIFEALRQTIYKYRVDCGPGKAYYQYVPDAQSRFIPILGVPYLIPDQVMRPKIAVTIDFTGVYAIDGKRLVPDETLQSVYKVLIDFYNYYFEYEMSYNKTWFTGANQDKNKNLTADEINEFINRIINFFLTSITVQRRVNDIGTASFTLKDNWNIKNNKKIRLFFDKTVPVLNQLLVPMLPIMFWASGRIYKDWMFPLFDGYLTSVSDSNSEGFISITGNCRDALELARFSHEMVNPAFMQIGEKEGKTQEDINIFNKPFYGLDHFNIIQAMFIGGSVVWAETATSNGFKRTIKIGGQKKAGNQSFDGLGNYGLVSDFYDADTTSADVSKVELSSLVERRAINNKDFSISTGLSITKHPPKSSANAVTNGRLRYVSTWGAHMTPYREFTFSSVEVFQSQFDSRLAILQDITKLVYYQLYVDALGNIQYHPYRLSTNFIKNDLSYFLNGKKIQHENVFPGAQIIGPEELLASNSVYNIEGLITFLRLRGIDPITGIPSELGNLVGSYPQPANTTPELERFGYRRSEITCPLFNSNPDIDDGSGKTIKFLDKAARELSIFMNAELYSRTDTLIFRPELELAMPICIMPEGEIFYIQSITHTVDIGGSARTEVNSNFGRSYLERPADIQSIMEDANQYYTGWLSEQEWSEEYKKKVVDYSNRYRSHQY